MHLTKSVSKFSQLQSIAKVELFERLIVVVIGVSAFVYITGGRILNTSNTRWLLTGDPAAHFMGWQFFRRTPILQWPLGRSDMYGTGFSSSIFFTDSIPIFAIPLKFLNFLLPDNFQYFGFWILLSFVFQSWFGWKLLNLYISERVPRILGSIFFTLAPTFLQRLVFDGYGQSAMASQWLILWAMYLCLKPTTRIKQWLIIITVSSLVHPYILVMVIGFFGAWVVKSFLTRPGNCINGVRELAISVFLGASVCFVAIWAAGGLMISDIRDNGSSVYRASLTSIFNPATPNSFSWSRLVPSLGLLPGSQEGFSFLGVGVILMLPLLGLFALKQRGVLLRPTFFLIPVITVMFFIFSLSSKISLANYEILVLPKIVLLENVRDSLRASGRFTWPLVYLLTLFTLTSVSKALRKFSSIKILVIVVLLCVQIFDTIAPMQEIRERYTDDPYSKVLKSSMWDVLAAEYEHIVVLPPLNNDPGWLDIALLADRWKMSSNSVYFSRINQTKFLETEVAIKNIVSNFTFKSDTLYVITNYPPNPVSPILIAKYGENNTPNSGIRAFELDGFTVVAP